MSFCDAFCCMSYQLASSEFAIMVSSATGTARKTWPAAENFSVFPPLFHQLSRIIASAIGNSPDRRMVKIFRLHLLMG
jgi:hypothetical protein